MVLLVIVDSADSAEIAELVDSPAEVDSVVMELVVSVDSVVLELVGSVDSQDREVPPVIVDSADSQEGVDFQEEVASQAVMELVDSADFQEEVASQE